MGLQVQGFHHAPSGTWSYLASDRATGQAAVIDPVYDYDPATGDIGTAPAERVLDAARDAHLDVRWLLETHTHADHLSATRWLKAQLPGAGTGIGRGIRYAQRLLGPALGLRDLVPDGSQFDRLFDDDDRFRIGTTTVRVIAIPGHTRDAVAYLADDVLFAGDSVFLPDSGTARCDFPGGDAAQLYRSVQRLYALPAATRVFVGHDYAPGGREPCASTTIDALRRANIHLRGDTAEADFIALREARDATLPPPALMGPALRANLAGGVLPTRRPLPGALDP